MSDSVAITLGLKATDADSKVLYDKSLGGTVLQAVTHHGRFTVTAGATNEKHSFPDIPAVGEGKNTFAVFLPKKEVTIRVGDIAAEERTCLEDVPVMIHDIADNGDYYFTTAATAAVDIEYYVGQVT
jgi:hypothetical protein